MNEHSLGWAGTGEPVPMISKCENTVLDQPCTELFETIALTTTSVGLGVHHPGLMWTASESGGYRISGSLQVASSAPSGEITVTFTRNDPSTVLQTTTLALTTEPLSFDNSGYFGMGDDLVLTITASSDVVVSVGVNLFLSGPVAPISGGSW